MQSKQDLPVSLKALLTLIAFSICGLLALLTLILQILFPLIFIPFLSYPPITPDMLHRAARIAFVVFCGLVWLVGIGYLTWLTVRSRRAQVLGISIDLP